MTLIACPKCGEKERYTAKYDTAGAHWRCQRCGYMPSDIVVRQDRNAAGSDSAAEGGD